MIYVTTRSAAAVLGLSSLLLASPASAIIHDQLPNPFDDDQVKPGVPSVLLNSNQTEVPDLLRGESDRQSPGERSGPSGNYTGVV